MKRFFFPIRWKLSLSLVGLSLSLLLIYVGIAKNTFESDKLAYVFDQQQATLESVGRSTATRFEQALNNAKAISATYDFAKKKLNPIGELLFQQQPDLQAIEVISGKDHVVTVRVEKTASDLDPKTDSLSDGEKQIGKVTILSQGDARFLLISREMFQGEALELRALIHAPDLFAGQNSGQLILVNGARVLAVSAQKFSEETLNELAETIGRGRGEQTLTMEINGKTYLVSSMSVNKTNLKIISITSKDEVLSVLDVLFKRSAIFILFSAFSTVLIALLLSKRLTSNLNLLTRATERIGTGDFNFENRIVSRDEIGILSNAFRKMGLEISRLLDETKDKARMEEELKTASLVQESLFPKNVELTHGSFSLNGFFMTSSECGGDWWYYFKRDDRLFVMIADATGHGTPSALITSASRALFSRIERNQASLQEIARDWDFAVASCSNQRIFMTALIVEIDLKSGDYTVVNASHPPPLVVGQNGSSAEFLNLVPDARWGEISEARWHEQKFHLGVGESLVLFTDGLTDVANAKGETISEVRFMKAAQRADQNDGAALHPAQSMTQKIWSAFNEHRQNTPLPDDVTLVVINRSDEAV